MAEEGEDPSSTDTEEEQTDELAEPQSPPPEESKTVDKEVKKDWVFGSDEDEELTHAALTNKWVSFIKRYVLKNQEKVLAHKKMQSDYYSYYYNIVNHMMAAQKIMLVIDYDHVEDAIYNQGLSDDRGKTLTAIKRTIITEPVNAMRAMRDAGFEILKEIHPEYAEEIKNSFRTVLSRVPNRKEIPAINHEDIGKLVSIQGFITSVEERRSLDIAVAYVCPDGHVNQAETHGFRHDKPNACYICSSKKLERRSDESRKTTLQEIHIQQLPSRADAGRIMADLRIILIGKDLIDVVKGGELAEVTGFVRTEDDPSPSKNSLSNFYMEGLYVGKKSDESLVRQQVLDLEQIKHADYDKLKHSVAPSVLGHEPLKEAILLMMAGANPRKYGADETRFRGDLELLLLGDPSTAKTTLAEYAYKLFPRAVYISGQVTEAGFTASVDYIEGRASLKAGAYLLASGNLGGLVVADEITRTEKSARRVLASILDNKQLVSIQKGSIHKEIKVKAASLHMGNPVGQESWDDSKSLVDNTSLEPWLLSRYDLIFVVRDIPDATADAAKAKHYLTELADSVEEEDLEDDTGSPASYEAHERVVTAAHAKGVFTIDEMRAIAVHMKQFRPVIRGNSDALKLLFDYYTKTRQQHGDLKKLADDALAGDEDSYIKFTDRRSTIPSRITMRDLGAAARLALASARAHFRDEVAVEDAEIAINLLQISMVGSGYNPLIGFSEEKQKREIAQQKKREETDLIESRRKKNLATLEYARQQKVAKRKLEGKWKNDLRAFRALIARYGFLPCHDCTTTGRINQGGYNGPYQDCGSCYGKGWRPESFTISQFHEPLVEYGKMSQQDFDIIWGQFIGQGNIVPGDSEGFFVYSGDRRELSGRGLDTDNILDALVSPSGVFDNIPTPPEEENLEDRAVRLLREAKERKEKQEQ